MRALRDLLLVDGGAEEVGLEDVLDEGRPSVLEAGEGIGDCCCAGVLGVDWNDAWRS